MTALKALCIAFSIYSKIPVPIFDWKEKEMKYQLIFFPWVGAVIGLLYLLWSWLGSVYQIEKIAFVGIGTAIPLLVTGGFHVDGFMDTMDALKSYKSREEKLQILKDPHIGAFSVLMLTACGLLFLSAFSQMKTEYIPLFGGCFFLSRCFSALGVLILPSAKKGGMLNYFSESAGEEKRIVLVSILLELFFCAAWMLFLGKWAGAICLIGAFLTFLYYRWKSKKEFGGISGDTAGYFVTICETVCALLLAIFSTVV